MSRALVTFATGPFEPLLDISFPGFNEYAARHGYEIRTDPPRLLTRPASWGKVLVMLKALETHDAVLWVDCDVVILDATLDLADLVPERAWQAITRHETVEGEVPSAGVWYATRDMRGPLEKIWEMQRYLHHRWWEQAGLQELLGYTPLEVPVHRARPTGLYDRTFWLDAHEWNALAFTGTDAAGVRFAHCGAGLGPVSRAQIMQALIERSTSEQVPA